MLRERYAPWILGAGFLASAALSWFQRSPTAGTILGVFFIITLIPLPSLKYGLQFGALLGGIVGAISEAVLYSPERGIGRTVFATGYGALLGALWGVAIAFGWRLCQRLADRRANPVAPTTQTRNDQ